MAQLNDDDTSNIDIATRTPSVVLQAVQTRSMHMKPVDMNNDNAATKKNVKKKVKKITKKNKKTAKQIVNDTSTQEHTPSLDRYRLENGLLYTLRDERRRLCIPTSDIKIQHELIRLHHDLPSAGHFKFAKTYGSISRSLYWPRMMTTIKKYIKTCDLCQRNTAPNQLTPGLLMPLETPADRWTSISMDDITGLPTTSRGNDAILTVIDRFTHRARFIPHKTTDTARDIMQLFVDHVATQFGFPESIVSDRDTRFTSQFWTELLKLLNVQAKMTTSAHQQANGLAERTNRTIEDILRNYTTYTNDDWDLKLSMAEFAYNHAINTTIQMTPFEADLGRLPSSPLIYTRLKLEPTTNPSATQFAENLALTRNLVYDLIRDSQDRMKRYYDKKHRPLQLKVHDRVLLNRNCLTLDTYRQQKLKKLLPRWIGPFEILEQVSPLSYRLKLPPHVRAHPIFHISTMKKYYDPDPDDDRKFPQPLPTLIDDQEEYEVERILDTRISRNRREYLVQWKGYPSDENMWIPEYDLNAPDLLREFEDKRKSNPGVLQV